MKTLAFFFALMLPLFARIGETVEQCDARYGVPGPIDTEGVRFYKKAGFEIGIVFQEGKAAAMMIWKVEKDAVGRPMAMSDTEIEKLLDSNVRGSKWLKADFGGLRKNWELEDGSALASYDSIAHKMMFTTREYMKHSLREKQQKEKENLDGF